MSGGVTYKRGSGGACVVAILVRQKIFVTAVLSSLDFFVPERLLVPKIPERRPVVRTIAGHTRHYAGTLVLLEIKTS